MKTPFGTGTIHGGDLCERAIIEGCGIPHNEPWYTTEDGTRWSAYDVTYTPDPKPKKKPDPVNKLSLFPPEDNAESRLAHTLFVVEATPFEHFTLWSKHARSSRTRSPDMTPLKWESLFPSGWLVTIGYIDKYPCCIDITWDKINEQTIAFYYQCSQVTDSDQTAEWFDKYFKGTYSGGRRAICDAENFGHCLRAIYEVNPKNSELFH